MVTLWNLFTITYSENLNMYLIALFQLSFDPNSKKSFYLKVIQCHTLKEEVHHYQKCLQVFTSVYIFSFENLENMINSCVLARYFAGEPPPPQKKKIVPGFDSFEASAKNCWC